MMTSGGKRKPAKVERAGAEERRWRDLISAVSLLGGCHSERNSAVDATQRLPYYGNRWVATCWRLSWGFPIASSGPWSSLTRRARCGRRSPPPRGWAPGSVTRRRSTCVQVGRPECGGPTGPRSTCVWNGWKSQQCSGSPGRSTSCPRTILAVPMSSSRSNRPVRAHGLRSSRPVSPSCQRTPTARRTTATPRAGRASWANWPATSMPADVEAMAEQVFVALADPTRRAILAALASGGPATATDLAGRLPITRQAIAKHLALLAEAGLVTAEPGERRRVRYRLRSAPMQVAQQFLAALARDWDRRLDALKDRRDDERQHGCTDGHPRARGCGLGRRGPADDRDGHGGRDRARIVRVLRRCVGVDDGGDDAAGRGAGGAQTRSRRRPGARGAAVPGRLPRRLGPRRGLPVYAAYQPHGSLAAGAVVLAAGCYELTLLKRRFRQRCRESIRSGLGFGLCCVGSGIGLMLMALGVMSLVWMSIIAAVVLAQKLLPAKAAIDVPVAVAILGLGIWIILAPASVPGLTPSM